MKKKEFEAKLDREICDQTWYRINAKLRALGLRKNKNNSDYEDALVLLAEISKKSGRRIDISGFIRIWGLMKSDKKIPENLEGVQLKEYILSSLPLQPSSSVFYRWFDSAGKPFRASNIYEKDTVIKVIAYAHNWLIKKTSDMRVKTKPKPQSYITVNLSDFTPFSELINDTQGN
jgi:hypothetical protein